MKRYKYPSTPYLPWSPGKHREDDYHPDISFFEGKNVVLTEKMDGENLTVASDGVWHARSIETPYHASRTYAGKFAGAVSHFLPTGWRICGENIYAKHSIKYDDLKSYVQVFSIWNDDNECLSWDDTVEMCNELERKAHYPVNTVSVIWRGEFDREFIKNEFTHDRLCELQNREVEGYVMRTVKGFHYDQFEHHMSKFVRDNHVSTDEHWLETWEKEGEENELE